MPADPIVQQAIAKLEHNKNIRVESEGEIGGKFSDFDAASRRCRSPSICDPDVTHRRFLGSKTSENQVGKI
jgi:hypothetical protein